MNLEQEIQQSWIAVTAPDAEQDPNIPAGWVQQDLLDAASEMLQIRNSKAFKLLFHRMGVRQRVLAGTAMPSKPSATSHETKIEAGARYQELESVFRSIVQIASYREQENDRAEAQRRAAQEG